MVLGIETSCDETAASVVDEEFHVLSSVIESSIDQHRAFGGVVPELAGRAHVATIGPVVRRALRDADLDPRNPAVLGIAVTSGPGLIGSLLVGLSAAKAYALAWGVPFVGVNHLEGHLFAPLLENPDLDWPLMTLLVSGGHSLIVLQSGPGEHVVLGETIDDAAGEAYDKVARWLGLGYPGGPEIDHLAQSGTRRVPETPPIDDRRGLRPLLFGPQDGGRSRDREAARSANGGRRGVVSGRGRRTAPSKTPKRPGTPPRAAVSRSPAAWPQTPHFASASPSWPRSSASAAHLPTMAMCTDNAAMIAAAGTYRLRHDGPSSFDLSAPPNWQLADVR